MLFILCFDTNTHTIFDSNFRAFVRRPVKPIWTDNSIVFSSILKLNFVVFRHSLSRFPFALFTPSRFLFSCFLSLNSCSNLIKFTSFMHLPLLLVAYNDFCLECKIPDWTGAGVVSVTVSVWAAFEILCECELHLWQKCQHLCYW